MRRTRLTGVLVLAAGLIGCSPGAFLPGQEPPPRLFELTPKSTFEPDLPTVDWQLLVETPIAASGIDTSRIALKRTTTTLDYFAGAEWIDRAPSLVQTLIVESFENTGKIVSVGRESLALRADYVLKVELREFQVHYESEEDENPFINVRINLKLVRMPDRLIVAGETFGREITSAGNSLDDIVRTFDEALGKVLKRLVSWTLVTAEADAQSRPLQN